jgi:hypothetical protein
MVVTPRTVIPGVDCYAAGASSAGFADADMAGGVTGLPL